MRSHRLFPMIGLALAAIGLAATRAATAVRDFFVAAFELFRPEPMRFASTGPALVLHIGGTPIDPALAQSIRHESRSAMRAAARGI